MKRTFTSVLLFGLLASFTFSKGIDDVVAALNNGNVSQIARYFDNTIEITFPQKSKSYSRSQAEMVLRDFFANNPVKGFEMIHKGENAGSEYVIGILATKNASFRTYVFMKQKGDRQVLQELRFENR